MTGSGYVWKAKQYRTRTEAKEIGKAIGTSGGIKEKIHDRLTKPSFTSPSKTKDQVSKTETTLGQVPAEAREKKVYLGISF